MTDINKPRKGSMAFRPRQRATSDSVYWQSYSDKRILGFAGFKVGMTHVAHIDHTESPSKGQEVISAATVIEVPPLYVYGVRYYSNKNSAGDILVSDEKILKLLNIKKQTKKPVDESKVQEVRLLVFAQPDKTSISQNHPEKMEIGLGGKDSKEKMEYAKSLLGKELKIKDVFKPGEFVDVISITKGKGWQGAVKRFGVSLQRRKATGKRRHVGTLGQWHPAYVLYTVPQAGQTGYHKRTELNKSILKIGENIDEINPSGGFPHYGFVKNNYLVVKGSVPGPTRRLVKLRLGVRSYGQVKEPSVSFISLDPK
ncbi:50S ribosomal protein L3 [Candidatus Micrarchaeota archaeon]|nr:50S ribosomal protein L3 [Candidatus Micrarchaeota archaeon]